MTTLCITLIVLVILIACIVTCIHFAIVKENGWLGFLAFLLIMFALQIVDTVIAVSAQIEFQK